MKLAMLLAFSLSLAIPAAFSQEEFVAPQVREIPTRPLPASPEPQPAIEGIVAEVFKGGQPWQLVNPVAPARYGNGRNMVSWDPNDEGKPKGFIVFGIAFW